MGLAFVQRFSRKQLVGLVYVGISIVAVTSTAQLTQAQIQWFASVRSLEPRVELVVFNFDPQLNTGTALVNALVENPSDFRELKVTSVEYTLFVNSTTDDFSQQGSSEVALSETKYAATIPARASFNLTSIMRIHADLVGQLSSFLTQHPQNRLVFVQFQINLESSFGPFSSIYCYETPGGLIGVCPSPRGSPSTGGRGGGG